MTRVLLALIDGMRPDALEIINHPFYQELLNTSSYSLTMRTVMPSVTLPCHMSLFHSVSADRHGILTNTYVPQVRPV
ncbi:MAG: alkaline phosphatase family protein, partial [Lentisphaeria bacterium]|nr:alkaline phosphatase family protein [Lentisphaeria bacterium]